MINNYYLTVISEDNSKIIDIKKLTDDEAKKFDKASKLLYKLDSKLYFFYMVDKSYKELKNFKKEINNDFNNKYLLADQRVIAFEFYRLLHNYLSSVNLFLNQYSANIPKDYNKKFFKEFENLRKELYSKNVSYKIIYQLRNELIHSKLPDFEISGKRNKQGQLEIEIYIKRDFLLSIDKLKKEDDIKNLDEIIDIFEHMQNMNYYLMILANKIINYELENHWDYYDFLNKLSNEIKIPGKPFIANYRKFTGNGFNQNLMFLNKDLIMFIENILNMRNDEN